MCYLRPPPKKNKNQKTKTKEKKKNNSKFDIKVFKNIMLNISKSKMGWFKSAICKGHSQ